MDSLYAIFKEMDSDGNGQIDVHEWIAALKKLGLDIPGSIYVCVCICVCICVCMCVCACKCTSGVPCTQVGFHMPGVMCIYLCTCVFRHVCACVC